jgi:hypothetical protein
MRPASYPDGRIDTPSSDDTEPHQVPLDVEGMAHVLSLMAEGASERCTVATPEGLVHIEPETDPAKISTLPAPPPSGNPEPWP